MIALNDPRLQPPARRQGDEPLRDARRHIPRGVADHARRPGYRPRPRHLLPQRRPRPLQHHQEHPGRRAREAGKEGLARRECCRRSAFRTLVAAARLLRWRYVQRQKLIVCKMNILATILIITKILTLSNKYHIAIALLTKVKYIFYNTFSHQILQYDATFFR